MLICYVKEMLNLMFNYDIKVMGLLAMCVVMLCAMQNEITV